jgi:magnesium transporter
MLHFHRLSSKKMGLPPGSLIHLGERKTEEVELTVLQYDETRFEEKDISAIEDLKRLPDQGGVTWIHVKGLHQPEIVETIGRYYGIHPLILEDVLNTGQRPKIESYEECLFAVLKNFRADEEILIEQISIILSENLVISFQESDEDIFQSVQKQLRNKTGRIRKSGGDYLAYALIDKIIDQYFTLLEAIQEEIEGLEDRLINGPTEKTLEDIYQLKREILFIRRTVLPLGDLTYKLKKDETPFIHESTRVYLRDLHDHVIRITDTIETFREMTENLMTIYHSIMSNRMNEVIKVLTIISTTFIPLSFIAGIYGMNFKYMPELEFKWGYPLFWFLIVCITVCLIIYFKKKRWI